MRVCSRVTKQFSGDNVFRETLQKFVEYDSPKAEPRIYLINGMRHNLPKNNLQYAVRLPVVPFGLFFVTIVLSVSEIIAVREKVKSPLAQWPQLFRQGQGGCNKLPKNITKMELNYY